MKLGFGQDSTPTTDQKTLLSKNSRVFIMPKSSSPKNKCKSSDLIMGGDTSVKLLQKKTLESDISTEGSDTEQDNSGLKLGSTSFYSKCSPLKSHSMDGSNGKRENCDSFLETIDKTSICRDVQPKTNIQNKGKQQRKMTRMERMVNAQQATIIKPRRKFTTKHEKNKFAESYKAKKKTEICKNWELIGRCKFGDSCAFAHGSRELVTKHHLPTKYKTKMCKQFHEEGYCPYGNRCQFIHLIIQKEVRKFSYSDILKESVYQYESRSKSMNFSNLEDLMVNSFKSNRLPIFEELTMEKTTNLNKSDEELSDEWDSTKSIGQDA
eukprot:CAMPEP_0205808314 /NCGR_PEP_ID=MMETSP0205-20121125/12232_1 /ASSEMBLY_ACC=CAM_ASM_000278 /TAXON_ID=36767 /ORGANISM="Euplotes focardii, Strain TN1" /LENGTH=322 /DNA_ID=CAMNT_0053083797 /DNA_START=37 /DNA_END=1005 /DNA_ORIENTATION=-